MMMMMKTWRWMRGVVFDDNGDDGNSGKADDSQYLVSLILVLSVLPSCSPHAIAQHIISPYYQSSAVIGAVDYVENNDDGSECDDFPNTSSRSYRSCPESHCCTTYYFPHNTLCCQQLIWILSKFHHNINARSAICIDCVPGLCKTCYSLPPQEGGWSTDDEGRGERANVAWPWTKEREKESQTFQERLISGLWAASMCLGSLQWKYPLSSK